MQTVFSRHIEPPRRPFIVRFWRPAYFNVFLHEGQTRVVRVLALTAAGALRIARYHWSSGHNFEVCR